MSEDPFEKSPYCVLYNKLYHPHTQLSRLTNGMTFNENFSKICSKYSDSTRLAMAIVRGKSYFQFLFFFFARVSDKLCHSIIKSLKANDCQILRSSFRKCQVLFLLKSNYSSLLYPQSIKPGLFIQPNITNLPQGVWQSVQYTTPFLKSLIQIRKLWSFSVSVNIFGSSLVQNHSAQL